MKMERRRSRRLRLHGETGRIELPLHVVKSSIKRNNLWPLNYVYALVLRICFEIIVDYVQGVTSWSP